MEWFVVVCVPSTYEGEGMPPIFGPFDSVEVAHVECTEANQYLKGTYVVQLLVARVYGVSPESFFT